MFSLAFDLETPDPFQNLVAIFRCERGRVLFRPRIGSGCAGDRNGGRQRPGGWQDLRRCDVGGIMGRRVIDEGHLHGRGGGRVEAEVEWRLRGEYGVVVCCVFHDFFYNYKENGSEVGPYIRN